VTNDGRSITLHSSWTGLILNSMGALLLFVVAIVLAIVNGLSWLPAVLFVLGVVVAGVLAYDMPIATTFDSDGILRRAALRHHRLEWDDVNRVRRGRAGVVRNRSQNTRGGLVAWSGRKPYVLSDKMESTIEFDQLRDLLGHKLADSVGIDAGLRPLRERSPTWTHRNEKWHP